MQRYWGRGHSSPKPSVSITEQTETCPPAPVVPELIYCFFFLEVHRMSALKLLRTTGFLLNARVLMCMKLTVAVCRSDQRRRLRQRKAALIVPARAFELELLGCNPLQPNIYMTKPLLYLEHDLLLLDGSSTYRSQASLPPTFRHAL